MSIDVTRRDFLKLSALGLGSLALPSRQQIDFQDFPQFERLGRVIAAGIPLHSRPTADSIVTRRLAEDEIIPVLHRVVGHRPFRINQNWVETLEGYVWSPEVQPVRNLPNQPVPALPSTTLGDGMWVEVSVPYVNLQLANPPARAPWLVNRLASGQPARFFYSQIVWIDQIKIVDDGQVLYRLNERFGYGDKFWAVAEAFRPLTAEEMSPIHPEMEDKRIRVDINEQTISCFEGNNEVYFARASTGAFLNNRGERVDGWGTPLGRHRIWRKAVSLPLSGGSAATGWDLPGVGWISLFVGSGVALHSTYWHNNFGVPTSRGCVNLRPVDALWTFRWTLPQVVYDPGDITVGMPGGTLIEVIER